MIDPHPDFHSLLLPNESPEELANLISAWEKDFPGNSQLQTTLRNDLVRADWLRRRARKIFDQLQLDLYLTGLPSLLWCPFTQKHVLFFEKQAGKTQSHFSNALKLLAKFQSAPGSNKKSDEKPKPPTLDLNPDLTGKLPFFQMIYLESVNGEWRHRYSPPNSAFLEPDRLPLFYVAERQFLCAEDELPEQYSWVNINLGKQYPTAEAVCIRYSLEEFKRIIAEEAETGQLIDGKRERYQHLSEENAI